MIISQLRNPLFKFSATADITKKTFNKFQQKYSANIAAFKQKVDTAGSALYQVKRSTQKPYIHPFDDPYKPVNPGTYKHLQTSMDVQGAQQVSAHYQHFSFARRHALALWGGFIALRFVANTQDLYMFGKTASNAWLFMFAYLYFWTEGKKYFLMPLLNRFYRKIANMQMRNLELYYQENVQARTRNLMSVAKSQIQYKLVHNEYLPIRNNSLLNFLINQQVALKNHIHERAESILKQVEQIQQVNQTKIISDVMSQTLKSVDLAYQNNKQKIQDAFFELALEGIAKGKMQYTKDPILPYVIQTINQTVQKFSTISPEQQNNMVSLKQDQMESIRANDARVRDQFISNQPKIDGSLRNNEIIGKILARWGQN